MRIKLLGSQWPLRGGANADRPDGDVLRERQPHPPIGRGRDYNGPIGGGRRRGLPMSKARRRDKKARPELGRRIRWLACSFPLVDAAEAASRSLVCSHRHHVQVGGESGARADGRERLLGLPGRARKGPESRRGSSGAGGPVGGRGLLLPGRPVAILSSRAP